MKVAALTLGCKANQSDTQAMLFKLYQAGYEAAKEGETADVVIVNTCTVTNVSDSKSRQALSRVRSDNPGALVVAAGCYAQRAPDELLELGVDLALGPGSIGDIAALLNDVHQGRRNAVKPLPDEFDAAKAHAEGRTRANLKIQDGCDRFCAYCIIPYTRGKPRSRPLSDVREQVRSLAKEGFKEIVLTGIHLASYGRDLGGVGLLDAIASACEYVPRVRLGSLEPGLLTDGFIGGLAKLLPGVCRHFHVSLQSGSASVLKRMRRTYTPGEYLERIEALRAAIPNAAITTDVIAGFPEETELEHEETRAFLDRARFARIHVFPYSVRDGTLAAKMIQLPMRVRKSRARELLEAGKALEGEYIKNAAGGVYDVLIEDCENGQAFGHTDTYLGVHIPGYEGEGIATVRLSLEDGVLRGDLV